MNQDIRELLGSSLHDEPPLRIDRARVLAAGRRRLRVRQCGVLAGSAFGVVGGVATAVAAVAVVTAGPPSSTDGPPLSSPVAVPTTAPAGIPCPPAGHESYVETSATAVAEAGRLTEAFRRFPFPAPSGVEMPPIVLCAAGESWNANIAFGLPDGAKWTVVIRVVPDKAVRPDGCPKPVKGHSCRAETRPDGTFLTFSTGSADNPGRLSFAGVTAWRPDGTTVTVHESISVGNSPARRLLDDQALVAIATAAELRLDPPSSRVAAPTGTRATELSAVLAAAGVLPPGMTAVRAPSVPVEAMEFFVSQGGYKLNADLVDADGEGNLFIFLSPPALGHLPGRENVTCAGMAACEVITLPNGRKATVQRDTAYNAPAKVIILNTIAEDGTQILVRSANQSERFAGGKNPPVSQPTRPEPPLDIDALARIASLPGLVW
ncbi:MAG TPA: hypothetical protein VFM37_11480 [Pseudonocardiaceae bacterium]|nr:hypothetical protein [Pseudonocardiaceae bacterium]